jgi:hypothetical protein
MESGYVPLVYNLGIRKTECLTWAHRKDDNLRFFKDIPGILAVNAAINQKNNTAEATFLCSK